MIDRDRFAGCMLGLALGDALGAPREGGMVERLVWRLIGRTRQGEMRWTDDTQMSLDIAESLVALGRIDPDDLARRFAASYRWSRGYGPGAGRLLQRIAGGADWRQANRSVHADGSYGNGGAMRSPLLGLYFAGCPDELVEAARLAARVTHAHPLGEEGAVLVAVATAHAGLGEAPAAVLEAARRGCALAPFRLRLQVAQRWLDEGAAPTAPEVRSVLGNGIAATDSCVTAIYCALRHFGAPFLDLLAFVAAVGGDVDTIGAMAGALWGAAHGAQRLPAAPLARLEQRQRLVTTAAELHASCASRLTAPPPG